MNDLIYLSATECIERFRTGALSPVDVLEAQLAQAARVDVSLNAFTETMAEAARARAEESERRYRDGTARALEGVTVAAKEKHQIAGMEVVEASNAWAGYTATENAPVIDRLLAAGAIIHARTTTPEFSIAAFTHSDRWGVTRNPWNTDFSPGGSSGGAGAALAAGMTTLATASDIGGSTRGPAAFTGNVGYKAPYGRIPGAGPMSVDYYRGDGPMGRTVDDVVLFTNVISGPDPRDHVALRPKVTLPSSYPGVEGLRIALNLDLGGFTVADEIRKNTCRVAEALASAGAEIVEVDFTWTRELIIGAAMPHFGHMMGAMVHEAIGGKTSDLSDYARDFVEQTREIRATAAMFDAAKAEYAVQRELARVMTGYDALLCPTTAAVGFPAGDTLINGIDIDGHTVSGLEGTLTLPFNITNRCPVLAVPSGHAENGMPTGVQIVGHTYDDATVFRVGKAVESLLPWAYTDEHRPQL